MSNAMCRPHLNSISNKQEKTRSGKFEYRLGIRGYQGIAVNFVRCDNGMVLC